MLGISGIILLLMGISIKQLNNILSSIKPLTKNTILTGIGTLTLIGIYRYLLPYIIKRQEKQADILAAKTLINTKMQNIVDNHIEYLKKHDSDGDLWWPPNNKQIRYLKKLPRIG